MWRKFRAGSQSTKKVENDRKPMAVPKRNPGTEKISENAESEDSLDEPELVEFAVELVVHVLLRGAPQSPAFPGQNASVPCVWSCELEGILPVRLLLPNRRTDSLLSIAKDCGISPPRRLLDKSNDCRFAIELPMLAGMVPESSFDERFKLTILTSSPMLLGMLPERLFIDKSMDMLVNKTVVKTSVWSLTTITMSRAYIDEVLFDNVDWLLSMNAFRLLKLPEIDPENLLLDKSSTSSAGRSQIHSGICPSIPLCPNNNTLRFDNNVVLKRTGSDPLKLFRLTSMTETLNNVGLRLRRLETLPVRELLVSDKLCKYVMLLRSTLKSPPNWLFPSMSCVKLVQLDKVWGTGPLSLLVEKSKI